MRWPDGFVCPACGHEKGWALRRKAHTFECAGCRRQTSVTAGTIQHASKLPLTVWFWAAYLMATHSNGISALQLQKQLGIGSYRRLGCSPTSCAPAWSTPSATRCRAWWKSTRPAFHSGPKTILPPEGKDAATTARCSSSAPSNSGTETSQAACGWRNLLLRRRRPRTLRRNRRRSRRHRENRRLVRLRCGPRRSPQCPCRREDRRSPRPAVDPPSLLQPQRMGARRLPRAASQASAISMSSSFASTAAKPATLLSARSSASPPMQNPLPTAC